MAKSFNRRAGTRHVRTFRRGQRQYAWVAAHFDFQVDQDSVAAFAVLAPQLFADANTINRRYMIRRIIGEVWSESANSADGTDRTTWSENAFVIYDNDINTPLPDPSLDVDLEQERWVYNFSQYSRIHQSAETGGTVYYCPPKERIDIKPNKRMTMDDDLLFVSTLSGISTANSLQFLKAWFRVLIEL